MPVPHDKSRGKYGGSYLEEYEWWNKTREKARFPILEYMLAEIFLLRTIWRNNRALWPMSFTFHLGIYLIILTALLSIISSFFSALPSSLSSAISVIALPAYILGALGTVSLLFKRIAFSDLRQFSSVSTYFNLVFLFGIFLTGLISWIQSTAYGSDLWYFSRQIITFSNGYEISPILSSQINLSILFLFYLPWTGMTHFMTKFFLYHDVRWDDKPVDAKMSGEIRKLSGHPVEWSAPHTKTHSGQNWLDII